MTSITSVSIASGLQFYGLKKEHIKLLEFLLARSDRKFVVRELAHAAELPVTRAYRALAELAELGLVERQLDKKLKFGLPDPENRFRKFFAAKATDTSVAQRTVFDAISRHAMHGSEMVLLPNREEFYQAIYQMFARADYVKMLSRSQWGVLTDSDEENWRSQAWQLLKQRIAAGLEFSYIVDDAALRSAKDAAPVRRNLVWMHRQPSIRLAAADVGHAVSTIITDSAVLMGFRGKDERQTAQGLVIRNRDFVNFFEGIYDSTFNGGRLPALLRTNASR